MARDNEKCEFERLMMSQLSTLRSSTQDKFDENFEMIVQEALDWFNLDRLTLYPNSVVWLSDIKTRSFRRQGILKFAKEHFLIGNYQDYITIMRSNFQCITFNADELKNSKIDALRQFYQDGGRWHGIMKLELFGQAWGTLGFARFHEDENTLSAQDLERLKALCDLWLVYWQHSMVSTSLNQGTEVVVSDSEKLLQLTKRQASILSLLAQGNTAKQCAEKLFLSPRTIESHKYRMMALLDFNSHRELMLFAVRNGLDIKPT